MLAVTVHGRRSHEKLTKYELQQKKREMTSEINQNLLVILTPYIYKFTFQRQFRR